MSRLVTCSSHPGVHFPTPTCSEPRRESTGHRLSRWLERKLNPKQGRPGPACPACGNPWLGRLADPCVYCDGKGLAP